MNTSITLPSSNFSIVFFSLKLLSIFSIFKAFSDDSLSVNFSLDSSSSDELQFSITHILFLPFFRPFLPTVSLFFLFFISFLSPAADSIFLAFSFLILFNLIFSLSMTNFVFVPSSAFKISCFFLISSGCATKKYLFFLLFLGMISELELLLFDTVSDNFGILASFLSAKLESSAGLFFGLRVFVFSFRVSSSPSSNFPKSFLTFSKSKSISSLSISAFLAKYLSVSWTDSFLFSLPLINNFVANLENFRLFGI